jgi:WD40 repeat protein
MLMSFPGSRRGSSITFFDMDSLPTWDLKITSGATVTRAATFLNNSRTLVASDGSKAWRCGADDGNMEGIQFVGHSRYLQTILSVAISPDGELVATAGSDYTVIIWEVKSGKALYDPLSGHTDDIFVLKFSVDGKMMASGSADGSIWVWSTSTGQAVHGPMECHEVFVSDLCFRWVAAHFKT